MKLKNERYSGEDIIFYKEHGLVIAEVKGKDIRTFGNTKEVAFNRIKEILDGIDEGLSGWKARAKKELERELGVITKVGEYPYYEEKDALILDSVSGEANNGESEWVVFKNEDDAKKAALDRVEEDLEDEPYLFNQSFLMRHIDEERLRNMLRSDIEGMLGDYWYDIEDEEDFEYINRQRRELSDLGIIDEDDAKNPNFEVTHDMVEKAIEKQAEERLEDPVQELQEIYGDEEGIKKAIEIGGINTKEAAEEAVSINEIAHFIDEYDGNEVHLPSGAVAYGTN